MDILSKFRKKKPKTTVEKVNCSWCGNEIPWSKFDEVCEGCGAIEVRVTWKEIDPRVNGPVANKQVEKL